MKAFEILRYYDDREATLGILSIKNVRHPPLYTLEPAWLDNKEDISCVPMGHYLCVPFSHDDYKNVYEVTNVVGRTGILFHIGNYARNTNGCILPGLGATKTSRGLMVTYSGKAMNYIRDLVGNNAFHLDIRCTNKVMEKRG